MDPVDISFGTDGGGHKSRLDRVCAAALRCGPSCSALFPLLAQPDVEEKLDNDVVLHFVLALETIGSRTDAADEFDGISLNNISAVTSVNAVPRLTDPNAKLSCCSWNLKHFGSAGESWGHHKYAHVMTVMLRFDLIAIQELGCAWTLDETWEMRQSAIIDEVVLEKERVSLITTKLCRKRETITQMRG
jgi:hypothetical protein